MDLRLYTGLKRLHRFFKNFPDFPKKFLTFFSIQVQAKLKTCSFFFLFFFETIEQSLELELSTQTSLSYLHWFFLWIKYDVREITQVLTFSPLDRPFLCSFGLFSGRMMPRRSRPINRQMRHPLILVLSLVEEVLRIMPDFYVLSFYISIFHPFFLSPIMSPICHYTNWS